MRTVCPSQSYYFMLGEGKEGKGTNATILL